MGEEKRIRARAKKEEDLRPCWVSLQCSGEVIVLPQDSLAAFERAYF